MAALALAVFGLAYTVAPAPSAAPGVRALVEQHPSRGTVVWVIYAGSYCHFDGSIIQLLNRLDHEPGVDVAGVQVDAPRSNVERERLQRAFGTTFPVIPDRGQRWQASLGALGVALPAVVVVRDGAIRGIASIRTVLDAPPAAESLISALR